MINRDLIRIKVVQLSYAYLQNGDRDTGKADKELQVSLSKAYQLYKILLLLIVAITKMARKRYDIVSGSVLHAGKILPKNAFMVNKFALQLEENLQLRSFAESYGDFWEQRAEFVRNLLLEMEEDEISHIASYSDADYDRHKSMWKHLYRKYIMDNGNLDDMLETESLYWNGDKDIIDTFVLKTFGLFDENTGSDRQLLPEYRDEADKEYASNLLRCSMENAVEYQQYIREACKKWDFSRLAFMDIVIMQLAIAEMMNFPSIPIAVTINEYVELANEYSTPKSGRFINGILDAIAKEKNINVNRLL